LDWLLSLVNIGTLSAFVLVCLAVIVLRYAQPQRERPFRVPFVPVLPAFGVVLCLVLAGWGSGWVVWLRFGIWLVVGLAIYFAYSYRHSEARKAALAKSST
jgi:APA family basic amino acid/polyamine antiporter